MIHLTKALPRDTRALAPVKNNKKDPTATAIVTIEAKAMATAAVTPNAEMKAAVSLGLTANVTAGVVNTTTEEAVTGAASVKQNVGVSKATTIDAAMNTEAALTAHEMFTTSTELLDVAATTEMAPPRQSSSEIANNVAAKGETADATVPVPKAASATLLDRGQRKECKAQLVFPRRTEKCPLHLNLTTKLQSTRQKKIKIFPPKAMTTLIRRPI